MIQDDQFLLKKRKMKYLLVAYIAASLIALTLITLLVVLLIMHVTNLKIHYHKITIHNNTLINNVNASSPPAFTTNIEAQITVKNPNFGKFKFQNTSVVFSYDDIVVGEGVVDKGHVMARSTKSIDVMIVLDSKKLSKGVDSGVLSLNSYSRFDGMIYFFKMFKRKKAAELNCSMDFNLVLKVVQNISCK